jgi:hypothetical protein
MQPYEVVALLLLHVPCSVPARQPTTAICQAEGLPAQQQLGLHNPCSGRPQC